MKVVLPFRGEFGLKLFGHVPAVNALSGPKIVYCERQEQALFPGAEQWVEVERRDDDLRRHLYSRDAEFVAVVRQVAAHRWPAAELVTPDHTWPLKPFVPVPHVPQNVPPADVVLCPRWRSYGSGKNWPSWGILNSLLQKADLSRFAGGQEDSSLQLDCPSAWEYERPLDATLAAIHAARIVVATNAGLAVLAAMCGKTVVIISHGEGITAPGPVVDQFGRRLAASYPPIDLSRYNRVAADGARIVVLPHSWGSPESVVRRVLTILEQGD